MRPRWRTVSHWAGAMPAALLRWIRGRYSPGGLLYGTVVVLTMIFVLSAMIAHYFGFDATASILYVAKDIRCLNDDIPGTGVGDHCFGDYYQVVGFTLQPNPWSSNPSNYAAAGMSNYAAAGMLPNLVFGALGEALGNPRVGLVLYLVVLVAALSVPAVWASKGKPVTWRLVTFALFGIVSIPGLMTLDRGNGVGLAVPALLALLVGLRRGDWRLAAIAIVAATLVKPQFVVLLVILVAARRWKILGVTTAAIVVTNLLAYLAWPSALPGSIRESIVNALQYGGTTSLSGPYPTNVSFAKAIHVVEGWGRALFGLATDETWSTGPARIAGAAVVAILLILVMMLGRRIPAHLAAIVVLACACLFPAISFSYYLVFAIAVAAIVLRDPSDRSPDPLTWRGVLDESRAPLQRLAGVLVVLATAMSLTRLLLPQPITVGLMGNGIRSDLLGTSGPLVALFWMAASGALLAGWGRRSVPQEARQ